METLKQEKDGLEVLRDLERYACAGLPAVPAEDLERLKWAGLFHQPHAPGTFMVRVRVPNGVLDRRHLRAGQLQVLARLAERYGSGLLDLTTRQQVQLRGVKLGDVPAVLQALARAGITSLQTGADNVRNVTGCAVAGIDGGELLDALPIVRRVTELVLRNRAFSNLPRKFNLAITGCRHNCVRAEIQDLALTPLVHAVQGRVVAGFNLRVGGRLGSRPRLASVPDVFVSPEEAAEICRHVLEIYRAYGNRQVRARGRLGDLIEERGEAWFREELERRAGRPLPRTGVGDELGTVEDHIGVFPQRRIGFSYVGLAVPGGRLTAGQAWELARLAARYGSGEVRLTQGQNVVLVHVPDDALPDLLREPLLQDISPEPGPFAAGLVACAGRGGCRLAQVETKERGVLVARCLEERLGATASGRPWRLHFSGCQASCGQHQVADIGLVGKTVEVGGRSVEAVDIYVGGRLGRGARFGRLVRGDVPCDRLPAVLAEIVEGEGRGSRDGGDGIPPFLFVQQLLTFCRVVETGSFTRAAGDLILTQPAVTKQVQALENACGVRLLDRRPCRPTPAGAVAYAYAKRILRLFEDWRRDLPQGEGG